MNYAIEREKERMGLCQTVEKTRHRRSDEEIRAELAKLIVLKPQVVPFSYYGHDHRAAIQAAIDVLSEQLDIDSIEVRYAHDEYLFLEALTARDWLYMEVDLDEAPSCQGWPLMPHPPIKTEFLPDR